MGVNVSRVYMLAFTIGIFLAALGGAFTAPMISVQPGVSVGVIIVSLRGRDHRRPRQHRGRGDRRADRRAGARRSRCTWCRWPSCSRIYIVMAMVLMFRPEGLFQRTQARKI